MRPGLVVYRASGRVDAIDQYSRRLVAAIRSLGGEVAYVAGGLTEARHRAPGAAWVLLQYNPFSYGRWGVAPGLVRDALVLRRRLEVRLSLMVHEAWMPLTGVKSSLMGCYQRVQLRALLPLADAVLTSHPELARQLGRGAVHVPVGSNVTPLALSRREARERIGVGADELVLVLFGRGHPSRALDYAEGAISAVALEHRVTVLNLGQGAPAVAVPEGVRLRSPGDQTAEELSLGLRAGDLALLPLSDGVSTRRTTMMAALAHALPVLGLDGPNTDPVLRRQLELTPVGDRDAYAASAAALAADPARRAALGEAGRRLYCEQFDWPVLARQVTAALVR